MTSKTIANGILRAVGILVALSVLLYFLYQIRSVIAFILIAAVVSLIGNPIVQFLRKRMKLGNTTAVILTMILLILMLVGLISLFIPLIVKQGKNLSLLELNSLRQNFNTLMVEMAQYFSIDLETMQYSVEKAIQNSALVSKLDLSAIPNLLNSVIGGLGSFGFGLFTVLFISFFFLKDSGLFQKGLLIFIPDNKESRAIASMEKIKNLLSRYFIGLLLQIFILFVIYTVVLLILDVDNALVIAFLCALLNLIPYVGPIVGGILMVGLTMTSNLGADFSTVILPKALKVLIGFCAGQMIDNFISQPVIFSNSVKSHPLEIFLVIIIIGLLFGITGMVVAVPLYTAIKVIAKEFLADYKIVRSITKNI